MKNKTQFLGYLDFATEAARRVGIERPNVEVALLAPDADRVIGKGKITARWKLAKHSFVSSHFVQAEINIDGVIYTGRGAGVGMAFSGKPKAKQPKQ